MSQPPPGASEECKQIYSRMSAEGRTQEEIFASSEYENAAWQAALAAAAAYKPSLWQHIKDFFAAIFDIIPQVAMYSNDPTLARQAIVLNAQKQIGVQREIQATQAMAAQALEEQRRAQDRADRREDMKALARDMVQEMAAEAERRHNG